MSPDGPWIAILGAATQRPSLGHRMVRRSTWPQPSEPHGFHRLSSCPCASVGGQPADPATDAQWVLPLARQILRRHPYLQLHHIHDPNQDHLMIAGMSYFRMNSPTAKPLTWLVRGFLPSREDFPGSFPRIEGAPSSASDRFRLHDLRWTPQV